MTTKNKKFQAIFLFLLATMCFAGLNTFIKLASLQLDPYIVVAYRCGLGAMLMAMLVHNTPEAKFVMFHKLNFVKGFIDFISIPLWVLAMAHLKIGEVVSISYITPLFSTLLAVIFLKEKMNIHKTIVITLGIIGVFVIMQPTSNIFNPYSLLVLASCFLWGGTVIFTKKLTKIQHPYVIVFYSNFFALLISSPLIISKWVWIDMQSTMILVGVAVMAITANTLVTKAYRLTDVTNVIPFDYNRLLFSTLLGFIVFGEVIELHTYVGAMIIICCNQME
jgi:drug/metabolite transporter (DMT)-like permease